MRELEQLLSRLIEFGLLTNDEEDLVKKSLLENEMHLVPKTPYIKFIETFNTVTKKKYKPDIASRELFYENSMIHSLSDRITALKNAITDPWIQGNFTVLNPKWILKPDNISKYLNYTAPKNETNQDNKDLSSTNYEKVKV